MQGLTPEVSQAAKELLIAHACQPEIGARPLRRTIRTETRRPHRTASPLLSGESDQEKAIVADVRDDSPSCAVCENGSGGVARQRDTAGIGAAPWPFVVFRALIPAAPKPVAASRRQASAWLPVPRGRVLRSRHRTTGGTW
ncbi:hypothetical protein [Streptomyces sp. NPDC005773]|uniref:hypothetical protein n=1 Tax=Streptomyces sp. NPDC005773 TaxID=3364727 RepID=UPI0036A1ED1A